MKLRINFAYSFKYLSLFLQQGNRNYTKFRSNLKYWFDKAINDASDIVIKRKGGKDLVLITLDEYNSLKETSNLLTGKNRDVLLSSIEELEDGKGIEQELID